MYGGGVYGSIPYGSLGDVEPFDFVAMLEESRADLVYTVEMTVWEIGGSAESKLYLGSAEWATAPTDVPASQPFDGRLTIVLDHARSVADGDRIGVNYQSGDGTITFANPDGAYDDIVDGYSVDGREVIVRVGRKADPFASHLTVFKGVGVDWSIAAVDTVSLTVRPPGALLDVPVQRNVYEGAGGSGGGGLGSELVTNGTFNSDISAWSGVAFLWFSGSGNGYARLGVLGTHGLEQAITTVAGRTYRVFVQGRGGAGGIVTVKWDGGTLGSFATTSNGTYDVVAFGASSTLRVEITDSVGGFFGFDDTSVRLILQGPQGSPDVEGKRKPLTFGMVSGVPPVLIDPGLLIYQVHDHDPADGFVSETTVVYDRGVALTMLSPVGTYAELEGAPMSAGQAMSSRDGYFRIGGALAGTVFATVQSYIGGTQAPITTEVISAILARQESIVEIDHASFDAVSAAPEPSFIGVHIGAGDATTVSDLVANLMAGIGGWAGFNRLGQLSVDVFTAPSGDPVATFDRAEGDIVDLTREPMPSGIWPPPWRWRVAYRRNYTVFTDFAASVPSAERLFYAEPYRLIEASDSGILTDHPSALDTPPVEAFYADLGRANDEAIRLLALHASGYRVYRMTLSRPALGLELGDPIRVRWPRYGLDAGKLLRVASIGDRIDISDGSGVEQIEITAFG